MNNKELFLDQLRDAAAGVHALGTKIDANGACSDEWLQLMLNDKASSPDVKNAVGDADPTMNKLEINDEWRWLDT